MVGDRQNRNPLHVHLVSSKDLLLQQRHGEENVLEGLVVPAQLRQHGTEVEVGVSKGVGAFALPLQF